MSWLAEHLAYRRAETAERKRWKPLSHLRLQSANLSEPRNFAAALAGGKPAVIAEIKFRSPSKGLLRPACDVEAVAQGYARAGAAALSVLVDARHFGGEREFLGRARDACSLPILAKGFFVDPYDLLEARIAGADAALLIACALSRQELEIMLETAREVGLGTLMEVHDEADLQKLAGLEVGLVGVNHRNLETLGMDPQLSARLAPLLPSGCGRVAESGLQTASDLLRMAELGFDAVLMGTAFMTQADPGAGLAKLLEDCHARR